MVDAVENKESCSAAVVSCSADTSAATTQSEGDRSVTGTMDFGKFYNVSYLEKASRTQSLHRGAVLPRGSHFHRPDYFSHSKDPGIRPKKGGLTDVLLSGRSRSKSPASSRGHTRKTDEAVKLSVYPGGEPKPHSIKPIERDDFPGPPAPAVLLPEILKENLRKKTLRRLSAGDVIDAAVDKISPHGVDDDDEDYQINPKIKKELEEIAKLQDSPMAKVILDELTVEVNQKKFVDPRSASRMPSAKAEPLAPPRFASSINASPSRSLDRPRFTDEQLSPQLPKEPPASAFTPVIPSVPRLIIKPTFERRTSSLPPGTPGAFVYDKLSDDDSGTISSPKSTALSPFSSLEKKLQYPNTVSDLDGQKYETYTYADIKLTNPSRRRGLDDFKLEKYLSATEFERVLGMTPQEFNLMAEFKRNDLKRKADLF